jgi:hypothetical protein
LPIITKHASWQRSVAAATSVIIIDDIDARLPGIHHI